ncbi:MAG: FG-GAP-like repeat-containing protein, partial [Candidatus Komeilibacteria bacterium]|nr:FG-GAP-like repeat-containing protein [Candidatus Komeilibacteria bacterium]
MKKLIVYLTLITVVFAQPGLLLAAESMESSAAPITAAPIASQPATAEPVIVEAPAETTAIAPNPADLLKDAEPAAPAAEAVIPPTKIVVGSPVVNNLADNQAVNLNEPGRDPGEENPGAYQQEKSADNSAKKTAGLTGNLKVDQFSGAASYNLGLDIPAGRNGLNPSLLLAYNSYDKANDSWVGQGWNLDFGFIQRSTKQGTNNLYTGNEFTLSLGGQSADLIEVDSENHLYAPKEENNYLKIQYLTDSSSWLVIDTNGIKYYFGQVAGSRQDDPADQSKIFKWQLDKVLDTNDNFYRIEYAKASGAIYPSRIIYTGNGQTDGPMEVIFNLEDRGNDIATSYQSGFLVTTDKRLNNIEIKVSGTTVTKYQFAYTAGQNGNTSLLSSLTKKGYQGGQEFVLPATAFTYSTKQTGWTDDSANWQNIPAFNDPQNNDSAPQLVDFNGDSWIDVINNGERNWNLPNFHNNNLLIGDLNGDKLSDLVIIEQAAYRNGHEWYGQLGVYLNNGINGFDRSDELSNSVSGMFRGRGNDRFETVQVSLTDVNGDGLADIIYSYNEGQSVARGLVLNTGSGWQSGYGPSFPAPLAYCIPYQYSGCSSSGTQIVDINGDGLPDVFGGGNVYLNTGSGFEQQPNQQWSITNFNLPQGMGNLWEKGGARLTDLNGDGLLDITIAASESLLRGNAWQTVEYFASWLNTGSGWQRDDHWNLPMVLNSLDLEASDWGVRMLDINNDNAIDVVKSHLSNNNNFERQVYLGSATQGNQLITITNGYGGQTSLIYQPSGKYFDADNHFKNPKLPLNLETVKTITTTDGEGNQIVTDYDYQDGAYYGDATDYTLNQFAGFGIVTATIGNSVTKTYYHQGTGIDGYELGEYEDSIYKKGRAYREEIYQLGDNGDLTLQSAKVNTWKQYDLDHNRKNVYLDGTVNYDYTQEGEHQQQMAPHRDGLEAQIVNQQAIQASEQAKVLPAEQLSQLQQAQTFSPTTQPQLVSQSADGLSATYYVGRNENGQQAFQYQVNSDDVPLRDENEEGQQVGEPYSPADGHVAYNGVHGRLVDAWDVIHNAQQGNGLSYRDGSAELSIGRNYISRVFLPFNTANLPEDITVTSATLRLTTANGNNDLFINSAIIVNSNQHTNQLQESDYSTVGNVNGGQIYVGTFNGQQDQSRTADLNAEGRSWINPNGWTKLALRSGDDFNNSQPGGQQSLYSSILTSEQNDENSKPLLTVNFYYNNITPGVPTDPQVEDQVNPDNIQNQQPHFSAVYNDENANDQAIAYQIQVIRADALYGADNSYNSFADPLWDSGKQNLATSTANGARSMEIQLGNQLPLDGRQYYWRIKFWDNGDQVHSEGLWSDGQDYFYMDGSAAPVAPVNLLTESRVEPRDLLNQNPLFSAIYNDPNPIDSAKWHQIQVDDNNNFSSPVWDSEKQLLNNLVDNGARSEEIQYGGEPLAYDGTTYYWRIKFWDDEAENGTQGAWSEPASFSMFNSQDVLDNVQAKAVKMHYDFETGNVTEQENLGAVMAAQNGVFLNTDETVVGDEKNSVYEYAEPTDVDLHILAAPKSKVVSDPVTRASSTVAITYDGLNFGQVAKANPTKEDLTVPQTVYQKTFNAYGLVTQTADPLNHRTNVVYDNNNYYPAKTTNHLYQVTLTEYDLATGQIKKITDPNGVIEERDYDAFGRLMQARKTNPASSNLLVMQNYEYHDTDNPSWTKQTNYPNDNSLKQEIYTYFDGLGRTIQTREQSETANQFRVTSIAYNEKGNVAKQSLVAFANSSAYAQPDWNTPRTEYAYDAQNRVLTEEFIGDANHHYLTSYAYDGWNVLITDPNGKQKKLYKDAYGQLVQVDEYLANEVYSTKYEYNLLGKLTKITDSQNNTHNFTYDTLGRLTAQEEMHKADAQNFGVWSYQYDTASNLISKTDPKGQVTVYAYDSLNRILTEDFQGAQGTEATYAYDSGTYGQGRLYRVVSAGAATTYTYDKWGRVTKEAKTIDNKYFSTQWAYNTQSVPTGIIYPDNSQVYYTYNRLALPITLRTAEPNQNIITAVPLIANVAYSPLKQIAEIRYNSRIVSTNIFDPVQAYRLTAKRTVNPFNLIIQDLAYGYDSVGNITRLVDSSQTNLAKTTDYSYDDLYRLTGATVTASANNQNYQQTYAYDPIGNILAKSDIGNYIYRNADPYQASKISNQTYAYDQNGNLTSDGVKSYAYNWADRLTHVQIDQNNVLL